MKGVNSTMLKRRRVSMPTLEAGIDTVDTANIYSEAGSEELSGVDERASATGSPLRPSAGSRRRATLLRRTPTGTAFAPEHPLELRASLRRLRTDFIDLYQVHMQDRTVPIEETLRASTIWSGRERCGTSLLQLHGIPADRVAGAADRLQLERYGESSCCGTSSRATPSGSWVPAARTFSLGVMVWSPWREGSSPESTARAKRLRRNPAGGVVRSPGR